jgi:hypothetical protein
MHGPLYQEKTNNGSETDNLHQNCLITKEYSGLKV